MLLAVLSSLCFSTVLGGHLQVHDHTFTPDYVLRITREPHSIGCNTTRDTYLANGTTPGPALHIETDKITWIRVYNDVSDANVTMVGPAKLVA